MLNSGLLSSSHLKSKLFDNVNVNQIKSINNINVQAESAFNLVQNIQQIYSQQILDAISQGAEALEVVFAKLKPVLGFSEQQFQELKNLGLVLVKTNDSYQQIKSSVQDIHAKQSGIEQIKHNLQAKQQQIDLDFKKFEQKLEAVKNFAREQGLSEEKLQRLLKLCNLPCNESLLKTQLEQDNSQAPAWLRPINLNSNKNLSNSWSYSPNNKIDNLGKQVQRDAVNNWTIAQNTQNSWADSNDPFFVDQPSLEEYSAIEQELDQDFQQQNHFNQWQSFNLDSPYQEYQPLPVSKHSIYSEIRNANSPKLQQDAFAYPENLPTYKNVSDGVTGVGFALPSMKERAQKALVKSEQEHTQSIAQADFAQVPSTGLRSDNSFTSNMGNSQNGSNVSSESQDFVHSKDTQNATLDTNDQFNGRKSTVNEVGDYNELTNFIQQLRSGVEIKSVILPEFKINRESEKRTIKRNVDVYCIVSDWAIDYCHGLGKFSNDINEKILAKFHFKKISATEFNRKLDQLNELLVENNNRIAKGLKPISPYERGFSRPVEKHRDPYGADITQDVDLSSLETIRIPPRDSSLAPIPSEIKTVSQLEQNTNVSSSNNDFSLNAQGAFGFGADDHRHLGSQLVSSISLSNNDASIAPGGSFDMGVEAGVNNVDDSAKLQEHSDIEQRVENASVAIARDSSDPSSPNYAHFLKDRVNHGSAVTQNSIEHKNTDPLANDSVKLQLDSKALELGAEHSIQDIPNFEHKPIKIETEQASASLKSMAAAIGGTQDGDYVDVWGTSDNFNVFTDTEQKSELNASGIGTGSEPQVLEQLQAVSKADHLPEAISLSQKSKVLKVDSSTLPLDPKLNETQNLSSSSDNLTTLSVQQVSSAIPDRCSVDLKGAKGIEAKVDNTLNLDHNQNGIFTKTVSEEQKAVDQTTQAFKEVTSAHNGIALTEEEKAKRQKAINQAAFNSLDALENKYAKQTQVLESLEPSPWDLIRKVTVLHPDDTHEIKLQSPKITKAEISSSKLVVDPLLDESGKGKTVFSEQNPERGQAIDLSKLHEFLSKQVQEEQAKKAQRIATQEQFAHKLELLQEEGEFRYTSLCDDFLFIQADTNSQILQKLQQAYPTLTYKDIVQVAPPCKIKELAKQRSQQSSSIQTQNQGVYTPNVTHNNDTVGNEQPPLSSVNHQSMSPDTSSHSPAVEEGSSSSNVVPNIEAEVVSSFNGDDFDVESGDDDSYEEFGGAPSTQNDLFIQEQNSEISQSEGENRELLDSKNQNREEEPTSKPNLPAVRTRALAEIGSKRLLTQDDYLIKIKDSDPWLKLMIEVFPDGGPFFGALTATSRTISPEDPNKWIIYINRSEDLGEGTKMIWDRIKMNFEQYLHTKLNFELSFVDDVSKNAPIVLAQNAFMQDLQAQKESLGKIRGIQELLRDTCENLSDMQIDMYVEKSELAKLKALKKPEPHQA